MQKLYIADDNLEFAKYLASVAEAEGWCVELCANGRVLIEQLQVADGPALLLVDMNMPDVDGIEAIEGLADIDLPLRVRFMTGAMETALIAAKLIAEARSITVGRSIYKPVPLDTFRKILREEANALQLSN
ncbi:response regulator [Litorivita sp. NS0012-18]|uniref:response regulator n=1 Tax=Litorivita sp. NS0012-18 TaxID=3127655 RepID=UPI003101E91B